MLILLKRKYSVENINEFKDRAAWFESWFDSYYYHILYKHRDHCEAKSFIDKLCSFLNIRENAHVLDLACGKGRHAIQLNEKGFVVTGLDLSEQSIIHAQDFENERLEFYIHDMRKPFRSNYYDFVFNFFSSFGYFDSDREHQAAINHVSSSLKPNGIFVLDFMNSKKVTQNLIAEEKAEIENIEFSISRKFVNGFITKEINIKDSNSQFRFEEKVKALGSDDFKKYLKKAGLDIINLLGNYDLDTFDENFSDRLIIIARKA